MVSAWWNQSDVTHVTGDIHFAVLFLSSKSSILTIHDCGFMHRSSGVRRWLLHQFWLNWPVRRSAILTTVSQAAKSEIVAFTKCDPNKIVVIPNAVSQSFQPTPCRPMPDVPRFLQIGTAENKNVRRVLSALRDIPCVVMIIGELHPEILEAMEETGVQVENGVNLSHEAVVAEYRKADVVLFASTLEGFGMPIVEAQLTGRPVVTSNISSMPEVAGNAACLVDPFDVSSIREGILRVISDSSYRNELVERGFENAKRFDAHSIALQYFSVYERVASTTQGK